MPFIGAFLVCSLFSTSASAADSKTTSPKQSVSPEKVVAPGPGGSKYGWHVENTVHGNKNTDYTTTSAVTSALLGIAGMPTGAAGDLASMIIANNIKNVWYTRYDERGSSQGAPFSRHVWRYYSDSLHEHFVKQVSSPATRVKF